MASQYPNNPGLRTGNGGDAYAPTPVAGLGTERTYAEREYTAGTAGSHAGESVGTLLRQLSRDVPDLVVKELALARAELTDSMQATKAAIASMATGGAVLLSGLIILLMSAVYGLSNVVEPWLAALIVGAVVIVIGMIMVSAGKKKLEPNAFVPDRTLHQMSKDKAAMTGRTA